MNEQQAEAIADALGGEAWQSGGGIWVVSFHRGDGKIVLISDELVCVYADDDALDRGEALQSIELQAGARKRLPVDPRPLARGVYIEAFADDLRGA